ncbi:MAG: hypothetical protein BWY21_00738 [Parcubacteria group bacterium ADurb.Bin216]|nr:MAG: hypothetical protein BWY21_00738 [Parcubacteria group bacterium ADurb.Bin216]
MSNDGTKDMTQDNVEAVKKVQEEVKEAMNLNTVENIINSNEIKFEYSGKLYKVVKPTTEQKNEAYKKKVTRYVQLLQEKDENGNFIFFPEKKLKEIYKTRGIDIDGIDTKISNLNEELTRNQEKLGKLLTEESNEKGLEVLKEEIKKINSEIIEQTVYKNNLLEYSLENQSTGFLYEYLTFVMTLVANEKGEFERAFKSYDEFKKADPSLTNTVGVYVGMLLGSL